jgi:hypothetical protein
MSDSATNLHAAGLSTGTDLLFQKLADYFPAAEIKWKPQLVKGSRALALAYINTRAIMDRLDDVLGPADWEDRYEVLPSGDVVCTIRVRVGERWVAKSDVGSQSEQPDGGDRMKAAFSDAFKRAAVKFGIGRYIARMPQQWCDYDPQKRQFVKPPAVPAAFLPKSSQPRGSANKPTRPVIAGVERLTEAEALHLCNRIRAAKINAGSFLKHYDITRSQDLPASKFAEAVERCDKVISQNSAAATGQAA